MKCYRDGGQTTDGVWSGDINKNYYVDCTVGVYILNHQ